METVDLPLVNQETKTLQSVDVSDEVKALLLDLYSNNVQFRTDVLGRCINNQNEFGVRLLLKNMDIDQKYIFPTNNHYTTTVFEHCIRNKKWTIAANIINETGNSDTMTVLKMGLVSAKDMQENLIPLVSNKTIYTDIESFTAKIKQRGRRTDILMILGSITMLIVFIGLMLLIFL